MKFVLACLLALTGAFASCERVDVTGQSTVPPGPQSHNMGLSGHANPTPTLFDRIANSRETNRFQGVRHVELFFEDGPQQRHPLIRERVSADGQGAYAIEALEIVEPQMTADQRALFLIIASNIKSILVT